MSLTHTAPRAVLLSVTSYRGRQWGYSHGPCSNCSDQRKSSTVDYERKTLRGKCVWFRPIIELSVSGSTCSLVWFGARTGCVTSKWRSAVKAHNAGGTHRANSSLYWSINCTLYKNTLFSWNIMFININLKKTYVNYNILWTFNKQHNGYMF